VPGPDAFTVLAYGPAPGVELIPYFLALLGWAALSFGAILLSPLAALLRLLRRRRGTPQAEPKNEPIAASVPESPGEATRDRA
jgi:hypothetical protein